jgi:hypothetical protein
MRDIDTASWVRPWHAMTAERVDEPYLVHLGQVVQFS